MHQNDLETMTMTQVTQLAGKVHVSCKVTREPNECLKRNFHRMVKLELCIIAGHCWPQIFTRQAKELDQNTDPRFFFFNISSFVSLPLLAPLSHGATNSGRMKDSPVTRSKPLQLIMKQTHRHWTI